MYQRLVNKLEESAPHYDDKEILWLLDHIGHPSAAVRDDLVFSSLARGLQEGLFSAEQFGLLAAEAVSRQGLLYQIEQVGQVALTRSFTALVYANLLSCDGNPDSVYFQGLTEDERRYLLEQGLTYLLKEKDYTGYSEEYGWVHAFAHGADLLAEVACHPAFSAERAPEILQVLSQIFKTAPLRFANDEDWRLARVLYQPVLIQKMSQESLLTWLAELVFPLETKQDFTAFSNFRSCLLEVYVQLDSQKKLSDELRAAIQEIHY